MPNRPDSPGLWQETARQLLVCLLAVCLVTAFFAAVGIAARRALVRELDPLNQTALIQLKQAASRHAQDDTLKDAFREIDEQARAGFFRARAMQRRGAAILVGSLALALAATHLLLRLSRQPPVPGQPPAATDPAGRLVRRGLLAAAITVGVFVAILSHRVTTRIPVAGEKPGQTAAAVPEPAFDADPSQWPAFRGTGGLGAGSGSAPTDWDGPSGRAVLWKQRLPRPGFSSPIVWKDRVYVSGADEKARELYCLDAQDGRLLWTAAANDIVGSPEKLPEVSQDTGYAASTPVTDGERVAAVFASGDLIMVDRDGRRLWARNLGVPSNPYGHASSLQLHRGRVLVQYDHFGKARLLALAAGTGETLWEQTREVRASWASPILVREAQRVVAVLNAEPFAEAFDAESGEKLWSCKCMGGEVGPSPAYGNGLAFVTTDYVTLAAIRLSGDKAGTVAWETAEDLPDVSSPLAVAGLLVVASGSGVISCYDAATGKLHWRQENPEGYYSSPVAADGRIYLVDRKGKARIVQAAPTYSLVAECTLGEAVVSTPAIAGGRLYLRGFDNLYCIGAK